MDKREKKSDYSKCKTYTALCLALIILLSISVFSGCTKKTPPQNQLADYNVILIVVDTLAAKYLSAYNSGVDYTPNLDRLAKEGVVFENAFSVAPWTKPTVASLFTSLFPSEHGVKRINSKMNPELTTMAELYKRRDFEAHGVISHTLITAKSGYNKGFDSYKLVPFEGNVHFAVTSQKVTDHGKEIIKEHLAKKDDRSPLFLFMHYFDPHFTYMHHPDYDRTSWYKGDFSPGMPFRELRKEIDGASRDDVRYIVGLYEEEIAYTDFHIGRFLDYVRSTELEKDTLIIFTADHGEEFLEHGGIGHTRSLYDELINIPLIFHLPGKFHPKRISDPVSIVDILPTVMAMDQDFAVDSAWRGYSLLEVLQDRGNLVPNRMVFSEVDFISSNIKANLISLVQGEWKYILDRKDGSGELYNRKHDPAELKNVVDDLPETASAMHEVVSDFQGYLKGGLQVEEMPELERSPEEIRQLESLGYM